VLEFPTLPHVALAAAAAGTRLVHVSSDAVFSGTAPSYDETHPPDPVTPCGAAQAAAETAVKGIILGAVIARTSLIIGGGDSRHERLVRALAAGTPPRSPSACAPPPASGARWTCGWTAPRPRYA
jgi:dTDP-4-dehydrorhamnose reductase